MSSTFPLEMHSGPAAAAQTRAAAIPTEAPQTLAERAERLARVTGFVRWASVDPAQIGAAMRNFELGYFQWSAPLLEKILGYDAMTATCAPKRWRAVSGADWEISTIDDSEEARRQADFLDDFYKSFVASEAEALDMRGGVETLTHHLVQAQAFKYAAAEIVWEPARTAKGEATYHARAIHCPLRFFEATQRRLRILVDSASSAGEPLDERNWIVACAPGTPLLLPTMLLFLLKMTPLEDWAVTVETFAVPFVIGKTTAQPGDEAWNALEDIVRNAKNRFGGVVGKDVELQIVNGITQGAASPHRELVEYIDRAIAALWRGGDLSTISAAGDAVGANPQQDETDAMARADKLFVEGVLAQLSEKFLRLVFGAETRPKAFFRFSQSDEEQAAARIAKIRQAYELGLGIPENFVRDALGIPAVAEGDAVLKRPEGLPQAAGATAGFGEGFAFSNAAGRREPPPSLLAAEAAQFAPLRSAVAELAAAPDEEAFRERLAAFKKRFPEAMRDVMSRDDVAAALEALLDAELETSAR